MMHTIRVILAANARRPILVALLFGTASIVSAQITYQVNLNVGAARVTGYIVTDGTIGVLSASNIVNWNLLLNDPTKPCESLPCTVDLSGPNGASGPNGFQISNSSGADLSATATELLFNFSGTDGGYFYVETGNYGAVCFETATNCLLPSFGAGVSLGIDPNYDFSTDFQYTVLSGTVAIGTSNSSESVPASGNACNGVYNGRFEGNITVSVGQNCIWLLPCVACLERWTITGNVTVTGGNFAVANGTIGGNVVISGASTFSFGPGTTINGSVGIALVRPGNNINQICGTKVLGDVAVLGNSSPLQLGSVSTASCPGNAMGSNATIDANKAPVAVYNNSVEKSLSCLFNASITGGGNSAGHKLGQCAAF